MAAVYTRRLGSARVAAGAWYELYRAPSAGTVVVRDITVVNAQTVSIDEAAIRMRPLAKAGEVWLWYVKPLQVGSLHFELRQVLAQGEALEAYVGAGTADFAITGYVFE